MPEITIAPVVRDRLALALDTDDLVDALRVARDLEPWFGVAKVGLELFSATGPEVVTAFVDRGWRVFLDLKLHDIPTTVRKAARVLGALGASYVTVHAHGGVEMLRAGVEGLVIGAEQAGLEPPAAIAVTVLTSDDGAPPHILGKRVASAVEAGCRGIVCSASDVREAKQLAPRLFAVVPGIRLSGTDAHDHARAATPDEAILAGADLLVVGRAVTAAPDRVAAAIALAGAVGAVV
ncbi:MAG TPA: orotidine-5'-phosphate decarboxylase [Acidimicrobiales bacterium]|nr:orotidine-5'-phosphate decarboxylase [Acidimicrobiales bacterium]